LDTALDHEVSDEKNTTSVEMPEEENELSTDPFHEEDLEDVESKPDELGIKVFPAKDVNRSKKGQEVDGKFKCEGCDKIFNSYIILVNHQQTHSEENYFECSICGKDFRSKGNFNAHLEIHEDKKKYRCAVCKRRFNLKGNAKKHYVKVHLKNR
jgi:uncharacterized Zn-finger protein